MEDQLEAELTQPNLSFLPQLDFLRAVAVILVVIDHTALALNRPFFHGISLGFVGVTGVFMFFVHTALVLMWSLERKPYTLDFYVRRIFRVYPLAIVATLAVVFTHAPLSVGSVPYFTPFPITGKNLLANLFLIFNLLDINHGFHALLHVEWTLPWELQMYLLLPPLFAFARRDRSFWPLLLIWALAAQLDLQYGITPLSFPGSIPNFLGGVIAFVAYKRFSPKLPAWTFPIFLFGLLAALISRPILTYSWMFSVLLGLGLPLFRSFQPSWFTQICQRIARYSYGIYLTHPFGILIGVGYLGSYRRVIQLSVEVAITAVLAVISYHFIEKPMIRLGSRVAARLEIRALARSDSARLAL